MMNTLMKSSFLYFLPSVVNAKLNEKNRQISKGPHRSHYLNPLIPSSLCLGRRRTAYRILTPIDMSYFFYIMSIIQLSQEHFHRNFHPTCLNMILTFQNITIVWKLITIIYLTILMQAEKKQGEEDNRKDQMMARHKLNPELVKKYEEIFLTYEREEESGYVQIKDVPAVMKILGVAITEQEITDVLGDRVQKEENPLISDKINFIDFLSLFVERQSQITMKQQLMQAFKVFDSENLGAIPVNEMRYFLRKYGITMPEDEVQDLLKDSQPEDGYVKYQKFINNMLGLNKD